MTREQLQVATRELVETLPPETSWDELQYRIYARQKIEAGLADSDIGRVVTLDEVRASLAVRS